LGSKNDQNLAAQMGVAKSDSLRCIGANQILIENAERFTRIDLDLSDFEKRMHSLVPMLWY